MPFLGNVVDFVAGDPTEYINSLAEQYGHVFKVGYGRGRLGHDGGHPGGCIRSSLSALSP